jgi:hypothetical protein
MLKANRCQFVVLTKFRRCCMAQQTNPPPGSPEDIKLTIETLQQFFAEKLKAVELYQKSGAVAAGTANTQSVCHVDGTTDSN